MAASAAVVFFLYVFFLAGLGARAEVVEHTFKVGSLKVRRLCKDKIITTVNGKYPGPTVNAREGDTVVVHVVNESPYNITIHWHGIFQRMTPWADGPNYITQCPIRPGNSYTYKFNIIGQEGTLWWHAHVSVLRGTVYGALVIRPRAGVAGYPFPKPYKEATIMLGEWWKADLEELESASLSAGFTFNISDAFTINGQPGDLYPCSKKHTYKLQVEHGETYLLRIINSALNSQLFFKIAGHRFTVVAADASYTTPFNTDVIVISPGQTVDALLHADADPGSYYMAARAYASTTGTTAFDNTTAVGILIYASPPYVPYNPPSMPLLPPFRDTPTAHHFYSNLTALNQYAKSAVPLDIDERMFITVGLGLTPCGGDEPLCKGVAIAASMNNVSFRFPTTISMLEAHFRGIEGVYTRDFPDRPPVAFDYTNANVNSNSALQLTEKGTKVRKLRYNTTVEVVLQNTAVLTIDSHPVHLHGHNFYVLAQGFGNYHEPEAVEHYNLVNPQERNTIAVPTGGWAVIRFRANNPGVWFMHCHFDGHLPTGLAMAFEVENGPTPSSSVPPPPPDFPRC